MFEVYTWSTPNGRKPLILLEELGLAYELRPVDIGKGKQFEPDYLRINPNGKIPALVDPAVVNGAGEQEAVVVFESGAILIYLAEKAGRFLPSSGPARASALSWLMFQMGGVGPMLGQLGHFTFAAKEKVPYAIDRYRKESERLYSVLEKRLGEQEYLAGEYGIADMATYPWIVAIDRLGISRDAHPNVVRWLNTVGARPAVQKAMAVSIG